MIVLLTSRKYSCNLLSFLLLNATILQHLRIINVFIAILNERKVINIMLKLPVRYDFPVLTRSMYTHNRIA